MSRALSAQILLLTELPEHLDQSSLSPTGTRVSIQGLQLDHANTSSLSAILFPVEGIPSGATHLPGLVRRKGSSITRPFRLEPQGRSSDPKYPPENINSKGQQDSSSMNANEGDADDIDPNPRDSDDSESDIGRDYVTTDEEGVNSSNDSGDDRSLDRDEDDRDSDTGDRQAGSTSGKESRNGSNDGSRSQSDISANNSVPRRRPVGNSGRDDDEEDQSDDSSGRRGSSLESNSRRRPPIGSNNKKSYGSRRTPWGYPTSGVIPYPQSETPARKPFPKNSVQDLSPPEPDQVVPENASTPSVKNVYKNKPFPKPDYRVRGRPSSPSEQGRPAIIIRPDGVIRESVYPTISDSMSPSDGYEVTYEDGRESDGRPQVMIVTTDDDSYDTRSAVPSSSSSSGGYETVIEVPAGMPASAVSASPSLSRSAILLQRPTTSIFSPTSPATDGYNSDTEETIDIVDGGDGVGRRTSYIISRASGPRLRRPTVPTLIQLPGYQFSFSDVRRARKASN